MGNGIPDIFRNDTVPKGRLIKLYAVIHSHRLCSMTLFYLKKDDTAIDPIS
jgi:hypothetical protein